MMRKPRISSWKLIICTRSCTVSNELRPLQAQRLSQTKIVAIGKGPKHPPSESFSLSSHLEREERYRRKKAKSLTPRSVGNDALSRALCQISKSPFTSRIDKAKLPRRFTQPTCTIYNGRIDPVEHVSHFNQRMTVHSRNEGCARFFPLV